MNRGPSISLLLFTALAGCADDARTDFGVRAVDSVAVERDRCVLPRGLRPSDAVHAACARLFIIRNGYTDLPPVPDSAEWVPEYLDPGMEYRRDRLEREPAAICDGLTSDSSVIVAFRYADHDRVSAEAGLGPDDQMARAVRIDRSLSMRVVHQSLILRGGRDSRPSGFPGC